MAISIRTQTLGNLLALPDDGLQYELLGGELVIVPPPSVAHALIVGELFGWCYEAQRAGHGLAGSGPCAVGLDYPRRGLRGVDGPEPDVFFVRQENAGIMQGDFVQGVPDLVIEVLSPKTRKNDLPDGSK
jgi:Uma2 family endonuclease